MHPPAAPADTVGFVTIQFGMTGLVVFDHHPVMEDIHLVTAKSDGGTPGPTLCGIDRFSDDTPGWSAGGGSRSPDRAYRACPDCVARASADYPHVPLPNGGLFRDVFTQPDVTVPAS